MGYFDSAPNKAQLEKQKNRSGGFFGDAVFPVIGSMATGMAESFYKPIEVMGKGLGNAAAEFDGWGTWKSPNQQILDSSNSTVNSGREVIKSLRKRLANPNITAEEKKVINNDISRTQKNIDKTLKDTSEYFGNAKKETDPGHIINNAAQLALNLATVGTVTKGLSAGEGAMKSFQLASRANKVANAAKLAEGTIEGGAILNGLRAVTNPTTAAQGAKAFGAIGALQSGLFAADVPEPTIKNPGTFIDRIGNIATSTVSGGIMGAGMGAFAGWMGGKAVNSRIAAAADEAARETGLKTNLGQVAAKQELSILDKAKATRAASAVDDVPSALVINGDVKAPSGQVDLNPFNPAEATNTQLPVQNANITVGSSVVPEQMPLSTLGKAAQMENPAMAAKSVPPTITPGATTKPLSSSDLKYITTEKEFLHNTDNYINDILSGKNLSAEEKKIVSVATTGGSNTADNSNKALAQILNHRRENGTLPTDIDGWLNDMGSVPDLDGMGKLPFSGDLHTYHAEVARESIANDLGHLDSLTPQVSKTVNPIQAEIDAIASKNPLEGKTKNIGAEITPGKTNEIVVKPQITDDQVKQAVDALGGLSTKKKIQGLKDIGATDEQMRNTIGVDTNGVKLKEMEVVNQTGKPLDNPMDAIPPPTGRTAEEISLGTPEGLGIKKLDTATADWLDKNAPKAKLTNTQKVNKAISPGTNTIDRATETLGSFGASTSQELVKAQHYSSNLKTTLRPNLQAIEKQAKKLVGTSQTARQSLGKKLNAALENRALGDKAFTTQAEKDLYNNMVTVLDTVKAEMVKHGIAVRDNYTPYQMLKDFGESTDYLSQGLVDVKTKVKSGHALPRIAESMGEMNDQNIIDLLPNYANGMVDHLAYSPVIDMWNKGIGQVPASVRRNTANFNDGITYMNRALGDMVNKSSSSIIDRGVQAAGNAYYRNALYMNPKNAMYSQLQKLQAVADTTHTGRKIANNLSKDTKKLIRENLAYSGYTSSQDVAAGIGQAKSKLGKAFQKIDINRIGEESAVNQPFQWGFVDSVIQSDAYKVAKKAGMSEDDAIKAAIKNVDVFKQAEIHGNMTINDTMFGANSVARPEILRGKGTLKRALGMFQRFPLAESNFVKKIFTSKDSRVLEVLASGDPRKIALGESRVAYSTLTSRLKDAEQAIKRGIKIDGAPNLKLLQEQISISKDAIKKLDAVIKMGSNISGPKRAAAFTAMWLGSGAVATMWNGVLNYGNPAYQEKNYWENTMVQDPTLLSKVAPWMPYSVPQSGLTSPLIPFNKYGPNVQGVMNLIPGAGIVNRASGQGISSNLSNWLKGK